MDPKKDLGLTKDESTDIEELLVRIAANHPIELEEKIATLKKPLILECACPGWQPKYWAPPRAYPSQKPAGYKEGGVRYPAVPCSFEEQAQVLVEAVKAGCAAVHIHPRDPKDCIASHEPEPLKAVYDLIFKEVDVISSQHTWHYTEDGEVEYTGPLGKKLVELGNGNLYCQAAVILWPPKDAYPAQYAKSVQEGVRFMEEHHIKPFHKIRSTYSARQLQRVLLDTGVMTQKPFVLIHDMGHPFGWPMDMDPWMPVDMINSIVQTKQRLGDEHIIGVFSGGRNWLPITITAILAGVDIVRVGIEDIYWMYPHEDEVIENNIDAVNKIVDFCKVINRKIATVDEARKILGIQKT